MKSPRLNSEVPARMTTTHFIQQVTGLLVGHVFADASSSTPPPLLFKDHPKLLQLKLLLELFCNTFFVVLFSLHPFCPNNRM